MDITKISLALTSLTALAAVIGPVVTSITTVRANERAKKYETHSPKVYAAIQKFTEAYSRFPRETAYIKASDFGRTSMSSEYTVAYKDLVAAGYEIMSLLPDQTIQDQISSVLAALDGKSWVNAKDDLMLQQLSEAIAVNISAEFSPMPKRQVRKKSRNKSK